MALKTPLVITNGQIEQLQTGDTLTSTGAGSDISLTAGSGGTTIRDVVYISANNTATKAQANAQATSIAFGFATNTASAGATTVVRTDGTLTGFTGLTAGTPLYLDASAAGGMTQTAPTTVGQYVVRLGMALSATDIEIEIQTPVKL